MDNQSGTNQNQSEQQQALAQAPYPGQPKLLEVYIGTPDKTLYKGAARSISSINDIGPFDVLGKHENFITTIKNKITLKTKDNQKQEFQIGIGVLRTHYNIVDIFVGIEVFEKKQ